MRRPAWMGSTRLPQAERQASPGSLRDRLAVLLALVTIAGLGAAFYFARDMQFLTPGPLASAHAAIENCNACHTKSGTDKVSWVHGITAGDRRADSNACLTCHKMPDTAFNAHSTSAEVLKRSTERLTKVAARTPAPQSARAQGLAFPTENMIARGLECATCHQDHQGAGFKLDRISDEQCRSCHVVKFDSFDGHHPQFESFPFKRRTKIIYDHASHFGKHFPETAKKDPAKSIPPTCSTCHDSGKDRRVMAVAAFDRTCTSCHLDQITGKERASGPKGVAFLSLPGLDLATLKKKKAQIGEWPEASEAELTPFMKVMISRNERGRALIRTVSKLNLQDLSRATDSQIKAVTSLAWEIKKLYYDLIRGKAADVLADLDLGGTKLSTTLVSDLIASIPRDVVMSAHQHWLPNLGTEMASRPDAGDQAEVGKQEEGGWVTTVAGSQLPTQGTEAGQQAEAKVRPSEVAAASSAVQQEAPARKADTTGDKPETDRSAASEPPRAKAGDQTDDLLFPTEEELREMKSGVRSAGTAAQPARAATKADTASPSTAPAASKAADTAPQAKAAPVISIESNVDPESWADHGGWYRQDFAIFYRPAGHKDKFIYTWLLLTGPQAPKGDARPAAAVFDYLTSKDAQGSCTKCHSVDDVQGKGRLVNFSPPSVESKRGRFTKFVHEPHFGVIQDRGCLTCHSLEKGRPYLESYKQGDPHSFTSNFSPVKKDLCQTCHTSSKARQDCLLCHKYHVDGVATPTMSTKLPTE